MANYFLDTNAFYLLSGVTEYENIDKKKSLKLFR